MDDLYQEHILDHYEEPYHRGSPAHATHAHQGENPLCGDSVRVELEIEPEGKVREAWFNGEGCCISQAAASMLMEQIEGKSVDELKAMTAAEMLTLFGAKLTPNRQKCCLLAWRVLQSALYAPVSPGEAEPARND